MSQLSQRLAQAAARNHELLEILNQTEYAPPALKQNVQRIEDLRSQKSDMITEIDRLHHVTSHEHEGQTKGRASKHHIFGREKPSGQLTAAEQQREKDFLEAWQREREAQERLAELNQAFEAAQGETSILEEDNQRHEEAQREIDQMYDSIFAGPTPEVEAEDRLEQQVQQFRAKFQECQMRAGKEEAAMEALKRASSHLDGAVAEMAQAHHRAKLGLLGGGRYLDAKIQENVSSAQVKLMQCNMTIEEARRSQPAIGLLSEIDFKDDPRWRDILFQVIWWDTCQHKWIKSCEAQVLEAASRLQQLLKDQEQRVNTAKGTLEKSSTQLENARRELQRVRSEAFESMADNEDSNQKIGLPPPAYSERV